MQRLKVYMSGLFCGVLGSVSNGKSGMKMLKTDNISPTFFKLTLLIPSKLIRIYLETTLKNNKTLRYRECSWKIYILFVPSVDY